MLRSSRVAAQLAASQEGLSSVSEKKNTIPRHAEYRPQTQQILSEQLTKKAVQLIA
jgi:hypothetical protein